VQKEIREQCTEAGMNDFLAKPVSRDQLLETLDQLIATG
jgi:CheY-like chemotaxis protein